MTPRFAVALAAVPLVTLLACKKEEAPAPAPVEVAPSGEAGGAAAEGEAPGVSEATPAEPAVHAADQIAAAPAVKVTEEMVVKYLAYRKSVVERGKKAVERFREESVKASKNRSAQQATQEFAVRMRAIEEKAREEAGLTRDDVAAVGQVVGEVLAARQIWRMSGGDEAVEKARAELATLEGEKLARAKAALAKNEEGFAQMRDAKTARARFGNAAVDAVLKHEEALIQVQRDGAKVMAGVY